MRVRKFIQARPGRHLVPVSILTILLPGLVLAIVGVRALIQERALAAQETRERLDRSAALIRTVGDREPGASQEPVTTGHLGTPGRVSPRAD